MAKRLITSDCHVAAPDDLTDQLPAKWREYFPHVQRRDDGDYAINPARIGGRGMAMTAMSRGTKRETDDVARARRANSGVAVSSPAYDPVKFLADLERDSTFGAVLMSRVAYRDDVPLDAQIAYCQLVNDYNAEIWKPHLGRVAPGILLPYLDGKACADELERASALGLRPGLMPDAIWNRPYHSVEWESLWEAADALRVPLSLHVGSLRNAPTTQPQGSFKPYPGLSVVGFYGQCVAMGETLGWLVFTGVFERYPNLHIVMTEGYAGWLGFAMDFFDHHYNDSRFMTTYDYPGFNRPALQQLPSAYLKRQAHATFMWDPSAIRLRDRTGISCLLWGNDYPHPEGSFPHSVEWIEKMFAGVPDDEVDAITRDNAAELFGITV